MSKWFYGTVGLFAGIVIGVVTQAPTLATVTAVLFVWVAALMVRESNRVLEDAEAVAEAVFDRPPRPRIQCPHCPAVIEPPFVYRHIVYTCNECGGKWRLTASGRAEAAGNE